MKNRAVEKLRSASFTLAILFGLLTGCAYSPGPEQLAVQQSEEITDLVRAVQAEQVKEVSGRVSSGEPLNVVTPIGSALDVAARQDFRQGMIELLRGGADPNVGLRNGAPSPLHFMAETGDAQMVRALAAAGADLEYKTSNGATPLALAIRKGHLSTAKALIQAGADVNAVIRERSLLMHVVEQNSLLMAQMLLDHGVDVNFQNNAGETALSLAQKRGLVDLQMLLLQSGARG